MAKLTRKQSTFVTEYLVDLNATQAAIRAGFSEKTANVKGAQLMANEAIQSAIQVAMQERSKRTEVTADAVIAQLAKIAFVDIKDIVEWDGGGVRVRDSAGVDGTVLTEVSETMSEGGWTKKVKLADRMRALEMLGRHLGMFNDKVKMEVSGQVTHTDEKRTHVIHELISDPAVAERIRHNYRRRLGEESRPT